MKYAEILDFIPIGEQNAVRGDEICARFDLTARERQKLFEKLRNSGAVICSSHKGLFKPASAAELSAYILRETGRANKISHSLRAARKLLENWGEDNS
ncbi:hypothetical protein [Ruminococcus albus]|uniref:Uncharacterized protein n=1 Tax=Ruminococcus albus TaxID=1264 RepID=A0A1I1Q8F3_RUMAL|nr:hypothetical protein [Ruminococcus albus]SFD14390.1 hypothetical protein SAMN02910406_03211 [Ruminococcus albus]